MVVVAAAGTARAEGRRAFSGAGCPDMAVSLTRIGVLGDTSYERCVFRSCGVALNSDGDALVPSGLTCGVPRGLAARL